MRCWLGCHRIEYNLSEGIQEGRYGEWSLQLRLTLLRQGSVRSRRRPPLTLMALGAGAVALKVGLAARDERAHL